MTHLRSEPATRHSVHLSKKWDSGNQSGQTSIGKLLIGIFIAGLIITSLLVYSTFLSYRVGAVQDMAQADAKRISHLVFEHLYSVMRKGSNRAEIDDLVHHIQAQLPNYEVVIVRGEPVIQQFGERPGQPELLKKDAALAQVLSSGMDHSDTYGSRLRYLYPVKVTAECTGCHVMARVGEVNGVISISVSTDSLEAPIEAIAYPIMFLAFGLVVVLLMVTFLVLRARVTQPIIELTGHVTEISNAADYSRDLNIGENWPQEVNSLANNFNELMGQVRASHQQLREFSIRDPLTNLFNRRHFDVVTEQAAIDARQGSKPFAVMLLDLDHFKPINDIYGHAAGDAVLAGVAKAMQDTLRESDLAARIGGDEFAVLALATDTERATQLAERLRLAVETLEFRFGDNTTQISCSIGIACFPEGGELAADLLHAADTAMYADKAERQGGR